MTDQPKLFRAGVDVAGVIDYVMEIRQQVRSERRSRIRKSMPMPHRFRISLGWTSSLFGSSTKHSKKGRGDLLSYMMYPGEFHYFTRAHVLLDAWHRVDDFFAFHLQGKSKVPR